MKLRILTIAAASALALAACGNNAEDEAAMTETDAATDAAMADGGMASSATDSGSNASGTASSGGSGGGAAAAGGSMSGAGGTTGAPVLEDRVTTNPNARTTSNEQVPGGPVAPGTPPSLPPGQVASTNPQ